MKKARKTDMPRRQTLFWDVDPATIDPEKNARYVIERILDFGHDDEVHWALHYYPRDVICEVIQFSKTLDAKSRNLWSLVFGLELREEKSSVPIHCQTCRCFEQTAAFLESRKFSAKTPIGV